MISKHKSHKTLVSIIVMLTVFYLLIFSESRLIIPVMNNWRCVYAIYLAKKGDTVALCRLIHHDHSTVNYCKYYGRESILSVAIQYKQIKIAEELLASGANPNLIDFGYKLAPLHYAVQNNDYTLRRCKRSKT